MAARIYRSNGVEVRLSRPRRNLPHRRSYLVLLQHAQGFEDIGHLLNMSRILWGITNRQSSRPFKLNVDDRLDPAWARRHDDDSVAQEHRLGDRMSNEHHRHFLVGP